MRSQKWITFITFFLTVASLVSAMVYKTREPSFIYDISLAVFGSSFLGFIMSLTEYFAVRRNTMEKFWEEAVSIVNQLEKMRPVVCQIPEDVMVGCFRDEERSKIYEPFGIDNHSEHICSSKQAYLENITIPDDCILSEDEKNKFAEERYQADMEKWRSYFCNAIDCYIKASEFSLRQLNMLAGDLDFMFGNRTVRKIAYEDILGSLQQIKTFLTEHTYHMRIWKEGNGSFPEAVRQTYVISSKLFKREKSIVCGCQFENYYPDTFYAIDKSLEKFRVKIYRQQKEEQLERRAVVSDCISVDKQ